MSAQNSPSPQEHSILDTEPLIRQWAVRTQHALEESLGLFKPFFQSEKRLDGVEELVLFRLSSSCYQTSESVAFLLTRSRLWDAEILCRSVLEGTVKFAFLCCPDPIERERRFEEYLVHLPEAARLKLHDRALTALEIAPRPDTETRPLRDLLLSEEELQSLQTQYPRKARQALSNKWGFVSLVELLSKDHVSWESAVGALYPFMTSSHLAHKDSESLDIIWDREERDPARKSSLELAHAARELGDLIDYAILRVTAAYRLKGIGGELLARFIERQSAFRSQLKEAYQLWLEVEYDAPPSDQS